MRHEGRHCGRGDRPLRVVRSTPSPEPRPALAPQRDPWAHREPGWSAALAAPSESLLALSNGYLGIRGTLDEGAPAALAGTYLNGFYETRPIPYADRGYADPELDQVLVPVADGTRIRLEVEAAPLDVRTGTVSEHERVLDLRAGLLSRTLRWRSPGGDAVRVRSRRLVSLTAPELAAIEYEVEPTEGRLRLAIHSELVAGSDAAKPSTDPRSGAVLPAGTLVPRLAALEGRRALLAHETSVSRQVVAAGMDHLVLSAPAHEAGGEAGGSSSSPSSSTAPRVTWSRRCAVGRRRCPRPGRGRAASACAAPPSRGGRSPARSAPATCPRAPPPSTSMPTSRTRSSATWPRPVTSASSAKPAPSCWSRRRGSG